MSIYGQYLTGFEILSQMNQKHMSTVVCIHISTYDSMRAPKMKTCVCSFNRPNFTIPFVFFDFYLSSHPTHHHIISNSVHPGHSTQKFQTLQAMCVRHKSLAEKNYQN